MKLGPPSWRHSQRGALGEEPKDVKEAKQPGAEAVEPAVETATEAEPAAEAEPKAESKSDPKAAPKAGTEVVRPPRPLAACDEIYVANYAGPHHLRLSRPPMHAINNTCLLSMH